MLLDTLTKQRQHTEMVFSAARIIQKAFRSRRVAAKKKWTRDVWSQNLHQPIGQFQKSGDAALR